MLRPIGFVIALFVAAVATERADAQQTAAIDYTLRPTQDIDDEDSEDDIWNWENEPGPSALETPIGPPLLGPTGEEVLGPTLAGPVPPPPEPSVPRIRRTDATDPFAQRGISFGAFVIRPSIEVGGVWTDNAGGTPDKQSAVGVAVAPEINVRSEDERHRFEANARGEGIFYDDDVFDTQTVEARARLRYALTGHTSIDTEAAYSRFLEGFSDPDTPAAAAERPAVDNLHAALGIEQQMGLVTGRVTGFADRAVHEEVPLVGGGVASREELDNTEFGVRVRAGYGTTAALRPFAEAAVGRRLFDQERDDSGFARSSIWGELRGGLVIDRGEKLSGEVSLGYRREDLEDERLEDLDVLLANAAILWSPQRLTEVRLDLTTGVVPTSTPDASASIVYSGTLSISRNLTPRLRAEAGVGASHERRVGDDFRDLTFTGFGGLSYAFNRTASIQARYEYERSDRNDGGDFDAHTVGVRLRLQR